METLRKLKLKLLLVKTESIRENNFWNAAYFRSFERELHDVNEDDYDSIFEIINQQKNYLQNYYDSDFSDTLIYFEKEFKKEERCRKLEKVYENKN